MEQIIDIAKQRLDTYKAEVASLLFLNDKIRTVELLDAVRNMRQLANDIEELLEGE